jgi:hypothetical protein
MKEQIRLALAVLLCGLILASAALAQTSANYDLTWHVKACGGGAMDSANYGMQGTLGQVVAGDVESANYTLQSQGYWIPIAPSEPGPGHKFEIYLPLVLTSGS